MQSNLLQLKKNNSEVVFGTEREKTDTTAPLDSTAIQTKTD